MREQLLDAADQRLELAVAEARAEGVGRRLAALEAAVNAAEVGLPALRQLLTGEVPDHRAQLLVAVEAERVVDAPEPVLPVEQQVAALAVGVVRDQVEDGEALELLVQVLALEQLEVVLVGVVPDEELERAGPSGPSRSTVGGIISQPSSLESS